ncbi:hypothetical protein FACS1894133_4950 [Clostridia bacterium]|nr:hypothetical protein FACS1894133_4950 [Clostridia bacterium]
MVDVIGNIVDIDINAKQEVLAASRKAEKILADASARKAEIKESYDNKIKTRLELTELQYDKIADSDISIITARKTARIATIEKAMSDNRKVWEARILSEIIDV